MASQEFPTRPLAEVVLGFIGVVLVVPLLFKAVSGLFRGLFRFRTTRRLILDGALAAATTLLMREDVLDRLFGRRGSTSGLLKATPSGDAADTIGDAR
jgi:hypothetical protein